MLRRDNDCEGLRARLLAATSFVALGLAGAAGSAGQAAAQVATEDANAAQAAAPSTIAADTVDEPVSAVEEVVVTGSRAIRNGNQAPTPITVVSAAQLQAAAPTTIADALNQLPVLQNSSRPSSAGSSGIPGAATGNGANLLSLRGLGSQRTLVLLEGRRLVPTNTNGSTDINLIPQSLVTRVDVVTGGASAAYGSDAVAGVVNFILDRRFDGLKGEVQGGLSSRGDNGTEKASLTFGDDLGERAHVVAAFDYFRNDGIGLDYNGRDWAEGGFGIIPTGTTPSSVIAPDVRLSTASYGGLITNGVLAGNQFLPGGVLAPFTYGAFRTAQLMSGGDVNAAAARTNLVPEITLANAFAHVDYELTSDVTLYAEAAYGDVRSDFPTLTGGGQNANTAFTIYAENAYLPAAVRARLQAANQPSFSMGRYDRDWGPVTVSTITDTINLVGGVEGRFLTDWSFSAYYQHGQTNSKALTQNNPILANLYAAADAVVDPATGRIVCRTALTNGNTGCIPINLFGENAPSAEAIDYVTGTAAARLVTKQDLAAFDIQGEPFSLWAGPVSLAFGAEYRRQEAEQVVDTISSTVKAANGVRGYPTNALGARGGFQQTNPQAIAGDFDIREGFIETSIPLARDLRFAEALDVNAAVRYADYSTVGGVTTWKVGVTYTPVGDVRLRATKSRDVRAPNIAELFNTSQQVNGQGARDPNFGGASFAVVQQQTGNPDLMTETADTLTAGVVLQPRFLPGVSLSVDYYDIAIDDVILSLTVQQVVDGCFSGNQTFCEYIQRNAGGVITQVVTPTFNLASLSTDGVDIEASYTGALDTFSPSLSGNLGIRLLASYIGTLETINTGVRTDRAGELGTMGTPHWAGTLGVSYENGAFGGLVQQRYVDGGLYDATLGPNQLADNRVKAVHYTDLSARYRFDIGSGAYEVYGAINNLFDKDPPIVPNGAVTTPRAANGFRYDFVGRYFSAGLKFRF